MPPKHLINDDSLTFGVELEFVFAFHQDELQLGETNGDQDKIEKDLSYFVREGTPFTVIPLTELPQHVYNSWGINPGGKPPTRPYHKEPQNSLGRRLRQQCPAIEFSIHDTLSMTQKTTQGYLNWQLLRDPSVCGVGSQNISPGRLPHRLLDDEPTNWDSVGLEAVSVVYSTGTLDAGAADIKSVVEAVKGKAEYAYGSFITNQCGMHVHVQAPEEIEVLQELAILLLIYEEEISRLHPPCRRPHDKKALRLAGPRGNVDSNRVFWLLDDEETTPDIKSKRFHDMDRTLRALKSQYHTVDELRAWVRHKDTHETLAKCMNYPPGKESHDNGNRNRIVNFTTAARSNIFPNTIEFRQARGSLCVEEIMHWVKFCVGLVRLAHFYHEHSEEFHVKNWDNIRQANGNWERNKIDVFDLIGHMQLGEGEIKYWEGQLAKYQAGSPGDADDRTDNELPPSTPTSSPTGSGGGGDFPGGGPGIGGSSSGGGPGGSGGGDEDKKGDDGDPSGSRGQVIRTGDPASPSNAPPRMPVGSQQQSVIVPDAHAKPFTDEELARVEANIQAHKAEIDGQRVGGRTFWGSLQKKRAPVGQTLAGGEQEEESTALKRKTDKGKMNSEVYDFDVKDWRSLKRSTITHNVGERRNVTAATAIYGSMVNQYPDSKYATQGSARDVLASLDNRAPGQEKHFTKGDGQGALNNWTGHSYILVVVEKIEHRKFKATRVGSGDLPELYVQYRETKSTRSIETLWQPMARKTQCDDDDESHGKEQQDQQPGGSDQSGSKQPEKSQPGGQDPFIDQEHQEHSPGEKPLEGDPPGGGDESSDSSSSSSEEAENNSSDDDEDDDTAGGDAGKAPGAPKKPATGSRYGKKEQGTPSKSGRGQKRPAGRLRNSSAPKKSKEVKTDAGEITINSSAKTPSPKGQKRPAPAFNSPLSSKKVKKRLATSETPSGQKGSALTTSSPSAPKKPRTTIDAPKIPPRSPKVPEKIKQLRTRS